MMLLQTVNLKPVVLPPQLCLARPRNLVLAVTPAAPALTRSSAPLPSRRGRLVAATSNAASAADIGELLRLGLVLNDEKEEEESLEFDAAVEYEEEEEDGDDSFVPRAVPKKRRSNSKTRIRKNIWKRKGYQAALKAFSLAKSISTGNSKSFFVVTKN